MKKHLLRSAAVASLLPAILTACGGSRNGSVTGTTPIPIVTTPPQTSAFPSAFGASFANAFNASPFGQPIDPTANDVPPLNPTGQPFDN